VRQMYSVMKSKPMFRDVDLHGQAKKKKSNTARTPTALYIASKPLIWNQEICVYLFPEFRGFPECLSSVRKCSLPLPDLHERCFHPAIFVFDGRLGTGYWRRRWFLKISPHVILEWQ